MSFRSTNPRRSGSLILLRTTAAARRQIPLQAHIDRRSTSCLAHRQCLDPVTIVFPLGPLGLPLSFPGLSCPPRSRLRKDYISLRFLSCHFALSALKRVDSVHCFLAVPSARGFPRFLPHWVRFRLPPQLFH